MVFQKPAPEFMCHSATFSRAQMRWPSPVFSWAAMGVTVGWEK